MTKDNVQNMKESCVALTDDGKEIYESEVYSDYYGYSDIDGKVKYLFAYYYAQDDSYWRFIDIYNNTESYEKYDSIKIYDYKFSVAEPFAVCKLFDSNTIVVRFFNGKKFELEYDYVEFDKDKQLIKISRDAYNGEKEYNYVTLEGNLISDKWIKTRDEYKKKRAYVNRPNYST